MSYLEAVSTRPSQSMNVIMTDVVRTSRGSGGKDGPIKHSDTNSRRTSQGNADEGESLPMVPLAASGPADTLTERSDLEGPLKVILYSEKDINIHKFNFISEFNQEFNISRKI